MAKKFSQFPSGASISPGDSVVGLKDGANTRFSFATVFSYIQSLFVPTSRKVNNKALTSDITLDASDVGAVDTADVGVADGVASLDSTGKVPGTQLDLSGKQSTITASGILKGDGQGGVSAATAGTDYQSPLTAGTDYATPAQLADKAAKADLTSIQATGTTNTTGAAIPAGAYFYLNGILHQAKTQIDQNATFTVNTNCEQVTDGGLNSITKTEVITSECVINDSVLISNNVRVSVSGNTLVISGNTKTNVNGTNILSITLPSRLAYAIRAYFYIGAYGGTFIGEGYVEDHYVRMNISTSSNNGVFNVVTTLN